MDNLPPDEYTGSGGSCDNSTDLYGGCDFGFQSVASRRYGCADNPSVDLAFALLRDPGITTETSPYCKQYVYSVTIMESLGKELGGASGNDDSGPECPLVGIVGNYNLVGQHTVALFAPEMATALDKALAILGGEGITLEITTGFRTGAENERVGGQPDSQHLVGEAIDVNTLGGNFDMIKDAMIRAGLTWGGKYLKKENHHFQLPAWGQHPTNAQIEACAREHPDGK